MKSMGSEINADVCAICGRKDCEHLTDTRLLDACTRDDLVKALRESLELQAHYAELLNCHDGGRRIGFKEPSDWIRRLRKIGVLKTKEA